MAGIDVLHAHTGLFRTGVDFLNPVAGIFLAHIHGIALSVRAGFHKVDAHILNDMHPIDGPGIALIGKAVVNGQIEPGISFHGSLQFFCRDTAPLPKGKGAETNHSISA